MKISIHNSKIISLFLTILFFSVKESLTFSNIMNADNNNNDNNIESPNYETYQNTYEHNILKNKLVSYNDDLEEEVDEDDEEYKLELIYIDNEKDNISSRRLNSLPNIPLVEWNALYELYNATNGKYWSWKGKYKWNFNSTLNNPCAEKWEGVLCTCHHFEQDHYYSGYYNYYYYPTNSSIIGCNVDKLTLNTHNLNGTIPSSIGNLRDLILVYLHNNLIYGTLPSTVNQLTKLIKFGISKNFFTGTFPSLSSLVNLERLYFTLNYFTGTLPDLSKLNNLKYMDCHANLFSGSIPMFFKSLPNLEYLYLYQNKFNGTIPDYFSDSTTFLNLKRFYIHSNLLSGTIPSFSALHNIKRLFLFANYFTGTVPTFNQLNFIEFIDISGNALTGTIPVFTSQSIINLYLGNANITKSDFDMSLYTQDNILYGPIPIAMCNLPKLQSLMLPLSNSTCFPSCVYPFLYSNYRMSTKRCPGKEDIAICDFVKSTDVSTVIKNFASVQTLYFESVHPLNYKFELVEEVSVVNAYYYTLYLYSKCDLPSGLYIQICPSDSPSCIILTCANTSALIKNPLVIHSTTFSISYLPPPDATYYYFSGGFFGNTHFGFQIIVSAYVKYIGWTCVTPPLSFVAPGQKFGVNSYAEGLCSDYDYLSWQSTECNQGQLVKIQLNDLGIKGSLRSSISLLSDSLEVLSLKSNNLVGTITCGLGNLINLRSLDLSSNKFNETIPSTILSLPFLSDLTLSYNLLTGSISSNFTTMKYLKTVILSYNKFSGQIPYELCKSDIQFNFDYNSKIGCFQSCGVNESVNRFGTLPVCTPTTSPSSAPTMVLNAFSSSTIIIISVVGGIGLILIILVCFLFYLRITTINKYAKIEAEEVQRQRSRKTILSTLPVHDILTRYNLYLINNPNPNPGEFAAQIFALEQAKLFAKKESSSKLSRRNSISSIPGLARSESFSSTSSPKPLPGNDVEAIIEVIEKNFNTLCNPDFDGNNVIDLALKYHSTIQSHEILYAILHKCLPVYFDEESGNVETLNASEHGYTWIKVISYPDDDLSDIVERILSENPLLCRELSQTTDEKGYNALKRAVPKCERVILESLYFFKRYEITTNEPNHRSQSCLIHLAIDHENDRKTVVALKFMRDKDTFNSEIIIRKKAKFDSKHIIEIFCSHDSSTDHTFKRHLIAKGFRQYPYLLVMPMCDRDLGDIVAKEFDKNNTRATSAYILKIVQSLEHLHLKGWIHGDLKPRNIMRMNHSLILIDLDSSAQISRKYPGNKFSTAYLPPELLSYDDNTCSVIGEDELQNIVVDASHDAWSLGMTVFYLCTGLNFFYQDNSDQLVDQSTYKQLYNFSMEFKKDKLSIVSDTQARNLIALLLNKDPKKRPTMSSVLHHPFLTHKSPSRMVGEKAEFDVFISYRVDSDSKNAEYLYNALTQAGLKVWWDQRSLKFGKRWDEGFVDGLCNSKVFVPMFSREAINHPTAVKQNISKLTNKSKIDNFILEQRIALELKERNLVELICPIIIGDYDSTSNSYGDYFSSGCHPNLSSLSNVIVDEIEAKVSDELDRHSLGLSMVSNCSVKDIIEDILKSQGCLIKGDKKVSFDSAVSKIVDGISSSDINVI